MTSFQAYKWLPHSSFLNYLFNLLNSSAFTFFKTLNSPQANVPNGVNCMLPSLQMAANKLTTPGMGFKNILRPWTAEVKFLNPAPTVDTTRKRYKVLKLTLCEHRAEAPNTTSGSHRSAPNLRKVHRSQRVPCQRPCRPPVQ